MMTRKVFRRASIPALAMLALASAPLAWPAAAGEASPRLVPLPRPAEGPAIRRVTHDAREPVGPGADITVKIVTGKGAKVTARLGNDGATVPCRADPSAPGTYTCVLQVPAGATGVFSVIAEASDEQGRVSRLSSLLPVVIASPDPWHQANMINTRLQPVYFAGDDSSIDDAARAAIEADVAILRKEKSLPILVEGHCDKREQGDLEALSQGRAAAVADQLVALGLSRERITLSALAASEPVDSGPGGDASSLNRRAMILVEPPPGH